MFYLRVLPFGISRISCFCTVSYWLCWSYAFLVITTLRVLGCCQPRTPTSEIIPRCNSIPLVNVTGKILKFNHVIPRLSVHPFVLLSLTVLPRPSLVHKFFQVCAWLTSSFQHHIACLATSSFPCLLPLLFDCILLKPPGKCVASPSTLRMLTKCQLCSWWETPSLPSMIFIIIDTTLDFLSSRTCQRYECNLLSSLYYVLPWSITVFYVENVARIAPPLEILGIVVLLTTSILSWPLCWF